MNSGDVYTTVSILKNTEWINCTLYKLYCDKVGFKKVVPQIYGGDFNTPLSVDRTCTENWQRRHERYQQN